jgi:signal peptidase I
MFQELSAELLTEGIAVRFSAAGHSMHPAIRDGERITIAPVSEREVRRGDILLYRKGRGVIAHRVRRVKMESDSTRRFILRGDASVTSDEPVAAEQILGRVVAVERQGRTITLAGRRARLRCRLNEGRARIRKLAALALSSRNLLRGMTGFSASATSERGRK